MTNSKKANGLFLTMTVCIICFYLFGKGLVTGLPVSIRLISSEIVYLIPVLLCLLIGRDSIGKLIPHRAPRFHAVDDNSLCTPSGAIDDLPERIYDAVFHQLCAGDPE